jgi:phosphoribosylformylglycinamidine synthase II
MPVSDSVGRTYDETVIGPGQWREVALSDAEYERIVQLLGRQPRPVELGMFGAMWSEHCGYKHSRPHLKQLPVDAEWVLQGPGENAGAVNLGDGLAAVFKVESHNHPSAVEPYQGAATGVGGIVRDIFTMGARPVAILDSLRFGPLDEPRNRYLFANVVAGIGGYGNCLGIPTVGGEVFFDRSYNGNPLVNAMCVGVVQADSLMRARATGVGNVIMIIGARTGRDGLHGATFASVSDPEASHRGVIQVGNPFLEKLLLEACLELLQAEDVVAMQDLGAAGLTSSLVECASRGEVGAEIDVALVPRREEGMNAYEVMLSESQERMLLVVRPEGTERVHEIVRRWSLDASEIGYVTDDGQVRVRDGDLVVVEVPSLLFTECCPTYEPEAWEAPEAALRRQHDLEAFPDLSPHDLPSTLLRLLSSPNIGSRRPIWSQYDHTVLTNTVVAPGDGDAAVLRLRGTNRGIGVSLDCNSRYCHLDPKLGARHAVAEAMRNVTCVGGRPLGITNCLNFGNPETPWGAFQLREAVAGMSEACRELGVPVVSGNVSLYNESGKSAIMPTPTVGVVGLVDDINRHATMRWSQGDIVLLLGEMSPSLGGSEYLSTVHGATIGAPPPLDLQLEKRVQGLVLSLIEDGIVKTAHDCGLGGLMVALTEMAMISEVGIVVDRGAAETVTARLDRDWFGEAPSRILIGVTSNRVPEVGARARELGVSVKTIGSAEGSEIVIGPGRVALTDARNAWESALA